MSTHDHHRFRSASDDTTSPLTGLGWNSRVETAFDAVALTSEHVLLPARVSSARRGSAVVRMPQEMPAEYAPAVRRTTASDPAQAPTSGDWVAVRRSGGSWVVEAVLERSGVLIRQGVATDSHDQALAANIDAVLICEAADQGPNVGRLERFLSLVWASGATPVVAVTKAELAEERLPEAVELVESVAGNADVYTVSAHTGHGLTGLAAQLLPGTTWVLLGTSGAGKSSLVNAIAGNTLMDTGEIRDDRRGRHTTTTRELLELPSGALVIDIPGVRRIDVPGDETGVDRTFADIRSLADECRFRDCVHDTEPGCAVNGAIDEGELDPQRLVRWNKLRREAEWNRSRSDQRLRAERKREVRARARRAKREGRGSGHD